MSDFISRSALLAEYDKHHVGAPGGARKLIEAAPAVDAVPVVRCKDCKHWTPCGAMFGDSLDDMQKGGGCPIVRFLRLENDFCCCGERKADD